MDEPKITETHNVELNIGAGGSGLMLPLIKGSLPDFRPIFERYGSNLKREAERGA